MADEKSRPVFAVEMANPVCGIAASDDHDVFRPGDKAPPDQPVAVRVTAEERERVMDRAVEQASDSGSLIHLRMPFATGRARLVPVI